MRRSVVGLTVVVCFVTAAAATAVAQDKEHPFEVGGVFTIVELTDFQSRIIPRGVGNNTMSGLGGRFAYNINKNVAIDAEVNFLPKNHLLNEQFGQKMQGFVGLKAGIRKHKVGVFAKARPGVMWFGDIAEQGSCNHTDLFSVCRVAHEQDFVMDVGGVLEYYPADRLIFRADIGDTIIKYPQRVFATIPTQITVNGGWKNNLQLSFGVGWRF